MIKKILRKLFIGKEKHRFYYQKNILILISKKEKGYWILGVDQMDFL